MGLFASTLMSSGVSCDVTDKNCGIVGDGCCQNEHRYDYPECSRHLHGRQQGTFTSVDRLSPLSQAVQTVVRISTVTGRL